MFYSILSVALAWFRIYLSILRAKCLWIFMKLSKNLHVNSLLAIFWINLGMILDVHVWMGPFKGKIDIDFVILMVIITLRSKRNTLNLRQFFFFFFLKLCHWLPFRSSTELLCLLSAIYSLFTSHITFPSHTLVYTYICEQQ